MASYASPRPDSRMAFRSKFSSICSQYRVSRSTVSINPSLRYSSSVRNSRETWSGMRLSTPSMIEGVAGPTYAALILNPLYSAGLWLAVRSEEHTSELQSLMRISYAVFCLKKKKHKKQLNKNNTKSETKTKQNR